MKKLILCFTILSLSAMNFIAAEPENFIPMQSRQILRANANSIIQMPWLHNVLSMAAEKCRKAFLLLDKMKKYGIEPTVFFAGELWVAKIGTAAEDGVVLIKTALPEAKFAEFFKAQQSTNKNMLLAVTTIAGKTVYTGKYSSSYQAAGAEPFFAVYLAEDVIAFMPLTDKSGIQLTTLLQGGGNTLVKNINRKKLASLIVNATKAKEKIRSINGTLELKGKEKRDISIEAALVCKNAKTAMRKAFEMQFILPNIAGLIFGNDQQLIEELATVAQIMPDKENINLKVNFSQSLQDKIAKYLANPANVPALDFNTEDIQP